MLFLFFLQNEKFCHKSIWKWWFGERSCECLEFHCEVTIKNSAEISLGHKPSRKRSIILQQKNSLWFTMEMQLKDFFSFIAFLSAFFLLFFTYSIFLLLSFCKSFSLREYIKRTYYSIMITFSFCLRDFNFCLFS